MGRHKYRPWLPGALLCLDMWCLCIGCAPTPVTIRLSVVDGDSGTPMEVTVGVQRHTRTGNWPLTPVDVNHEELDPIEPGTTGNLVVGDHDTIELLACDYTRTRFQITRGFAYVIAPDLSQERRPFVEALIMGDPFYRSQATKVPLGSGNTLVVPMYATRRAEATPSGSAEGSGVSGDWPKGGGPKGQEPSH